MTPQEWIAQARTNVAKLRCVILQYHPSLRSRAQRLNGARITAANAQVACELVCEDIASKQRDPMTEFDAALENSNVLNAALVLEETWFGVPESMDCWQIEGFKELVDLLDDMPDTVDFEEEEVK